MTVGFIDTVHDILQSRLAEAGFQCVDLTAIPNGDLQSHVSNLDGIVIRSRVRMDENFLQHAPNLKFIARSGAGMENIDLTYCEGRGIKLYNAPEGNRNAVAEHAIGMILSMIFLRPATSLSKQKHLFQILIGRSQIFRQHVIG